MIKKKVYGNQNEFLLLPELFVFWFLCCFCVVAWSIVYICTNSHIKTARSAFQRLRDACRMHRRLGTTDGSWSFLFFCEIILFFKINAAKMLRFIKWNRVQWDFATCHKTGSQWTAQIATVERCGLHRQQKNRAQVFKAKYSNSDISKNYSQAFYHFLLNFTKNKFNDMFVAEIWPSCF